MRQSHGNNNFSESVSLTPVLNTVFHDDANDSDKSWSVQSNESWYLNFVYVTLVSTATVGNRLITLEVIDESSNVIISISAGTTQAASLTRKYGFLQGQYREVSFVNDELQVPLPMSLYIPAGYTLRVYDSAAVDAAADDMEVSFQVQKVVA